MKKSTILIIFIVYLASIVAIGFFGMASKVYDEIKYVEAIEISVEAESKEMYDFKQVGENNQGNKMYELIVNFDKATIGEFEVDGITMDRKYIALTLIPHVTYDTGDVANSEEESIVYRLDDKELQDKNYIDLDKTGMLYLFKVDIGFRIYVEPASQSSNDASIIIDVYVI